MDGRNSEAEFENFCNAVDLMDFPTSVDIYGRDPDPETDTVQDSNNSQDTTKDLRISSFSSGKSFDSKPEDIIEESHEPGTGPVTNSISKLTTISADKRADIPAVPTVTGRPPRHPGRPISALSRNSWKAQTRGRSSFSEGSTPDKSSSSPRPSNPERLRTRSSSSPRSSGRANETKARIVSFTKSSSKADYQQAKSNSSPRSSNKLDIFQYYSNKMNKPMSPYGSNKGNTPRPRSGSYSRENNIADKPISKSSSSPRDYNIVDKPRPKSNSSLRNYNIVDKPRPKSNSSPRNYNIVDKPRPKGNSSPRNYNIVDKPGLKSSSSPPNHNKVDKPGPKSSSSPRNYNIVDKPRSKSSSSLRDYTIVDKPRPESSSSTGEYSIVDKLCSKSSPSTREYNLVDKPQPKSSYSPREYNKADTPHPKSSSSTQEYNIEDKPRPKSSSSSREYNIVDKPRPKSSSSSREYNIVDKPRPKSSSSPREYNTPRPKSSSSPREYTTADKPRPKSSAYPRGYRNADKPLTNTSTLAKIYTKVEEMLDRTGSFTHDKIKTDKPKQTSSSSLQDYIKTDESKAKTRTLSDYHKEGSPLPKSTSSQPDCKEDIPQLREYSKPNGSEDQTTQCVSNEHVEPQTPSSAENELDCFEVQASSSLSDLTTISDLDSTSESISEEDELKKVIKETIKSCCRGDPLSRMFLPTVNASEDDTESDKSYEAFESEVKNPDVSVDEIGNEGGQDREDSLTPRGSNHEEAAINTPANWDSQSDIGLSFSEPYKQLGLAELLESRGELGEIDKSDLRLDLTWVDKENPTPRLDTNSENGSQDGDIRRKKPRKEGNEAAPASPSNYDADCENNLSVCKRRERKKTSVKEDENPTENKFVDEKLNEEEYERMEHQTEYKNDHEATSFNTAKTCYALSELSFSEPYKHLGLSKLLQDRGEFREMSKDDLRIELILVDKENPTQKVDLTCSIGREKVERALDILLSHDITSRDTPDITSRDTPDITSRDTPDITSESASDNTETRKTEKKKECYRGFIRSVRDAVLSCYLGQTEYDERQKK